VLIKEENGKTGTVHLPAEIWERGSTWTFAYKSTSNILYATLDPDHKLPDINPDNNSLSNAPVPDGTTAKTVIKKYLDAIGGESRLRDIKDITIASDGEIQGVGIKKTYKYKAGGKVYLEAVAPSYNNLLVNKMVINGDSVSFKQMNNAVALDSLGRKYLKTRTKFFPELDFGKNGYTVELSPKLQVVNGALAYMVLVTQPDGVKMRYYYDAQTGLKMRQYIDITGGSTVYDWSDYRDVNTGIKIPFTEKTSIVGQAIEYKVTDVTVNSGLTDDTFK
jgi:outer membrane lipoprotein-sorting protein